MKGYWHRLIDAVLNLPPEKEAVSITVAPLVEPRPVPRSEADLRASIAGLEMDVAEQERRIEAMRKEYEAAEKATAVAAARGGEEQLGKLHSQLAGSLANGAVLAAAVETGGVVEGGDWVAWYRGMEKALERTGLQRIGTPGERSNFSIALHQRMSGGSVAEGEPVIVRVPGYRAGEKIVRKVMVSAVEGKS